MSKVIIVVNAEVRETGKIIAASPVTQKMVTALRRAISANSAKPVKIEVVAAATLWSNSANLAIDCHNLIYCPLTIQLPDSFKFPAQAIYQACKDIKGRRRWVEQNLAYKTSIGDNWLGDLWLPVVLTAKGPLYGEVIGEGEMPNFYQQPVYLADEQRQPLYDLAYQLLQSIGTPPAVYLLQFSLRGKEIVFDRLWPFPAAAAIASLGVQKPDLFTCHWHCLTNQPICDLTIIRSG
ncbi:MAG: hypothetical protein AB4426_15650 [Xenococcaceae cyanobacterium]